MKRRIPLSHTGTWLAVALACLHAALAGTAHAAQMEPTPPPLWSATGESSDSLGELVTGAGDVNGDGYADAVVGGAGEFYVYLGSESGFSEMPDFIDEELNDGDFFFPYTFSAAGDVNGDGYADMIAGAPYDTESTGAVKLYYGAADGFASTPWSIYGADPGDELGAAVSAGGDVNGDGYDDVLIAAPGSYDSELVGTVFIFHGGPNGLGDEPDGALTGRETDTQFGDRVASAGDVNGDGFDDILVSIGSGDVAMLYYGGADGVEAMPSHFLTPEEYDYIFANSLTGVGDVNGDGYADVLVDAANIDDTLKAYVYYGSENGLAEAPDARLVVEAPAGQTATIRAAGDLDGDGFSDVAFAAVTPGYEETGSGTVYLYTGGEDGLGETPVAMVNGTEAGDEFGWALAGVGDVDGDGLGDVLIGAPGSTQGGNYAGKAYLFSGETALSTAAAPLSELEAATSLSASSEQSAALPLSLWEPETASLSSGELGEAFGWPASIAGDVNGDGFDDLLVNSIGNPDLELPPRSLLYLGSADGVEGEPVWELTRSEWPLPDEERPDDFAPLGFAFSGVGDINGDGLDDVALSVIELDHAFGTVLLYTGSEDGLSAEPLWTATSNADDVIFGAKVRGAGDVNGDGFGDLAVISIDGPDEQIVVDIYHGDAEGPGDSADWTVDELDAFEGIGVGFAAPGDVDGDGFDDILVGAPGFPQGEGMGSVSLYRGGEDGLQAQPAWNQVGAGFETYVGLGVTSLGDVNGDGTSEFAVSMPGYADWQGRIVIYTAGEDALSTGLTEPAPQTIEGDFPEGYFGVLVEGAGDVNGDGFADLLVGNVDEEGADTFVWQLFLGSEAGIVPEPRFSTRLPTADEFTMLFQQVAPGDLNGDGYSDLVFSDVNLEALQDGEALTSTVSVYFGGEIPELPAPGSALLPDPSGLESGTDSGSWRLADEIPLDFYPLDAHSLSPDGQWLLLDEWGEQLCIYSTDTFAEQHCTPYADELPNGYAYEELAWSPDGSYVVLTEDVLVEWEDADLWLLDVFDGGLTNMTDDDVAGSLDEITEPVLVDVAPTWSSDSEHVLFARDVMVEGETQQTGLYGIAPGDDEAELLLELDTDTLLPVWTGMRYLSTDESKDDSILYTYFAEDVDDPLNGIWWIDFDGEAEQLLAAAPGSGPPVLMDVDASGTWALVYYMLADSVLYDESGDVDFGTDPVPVMTYALLNLEDGSAVAVQPETVGDGEYAMVVSATFSPDGSTLLFTYVLAEDLVAMAEGAEVAEYVLAARPVGGSGDTILMYSPEELGRGYLSQSRLNWASNNLVYVPTFDGGYLLELSEQ